MLKNIIVYFGFFLSMILSYLLISNIDLYKIDTDKISWSYIALGILCYVFAYIVHAKRWSLFFKDKKYHFLDLLKAIVLSQLFNNILPSRAGEFVRPLVISRIYSLSYTRLLTTCLVERIFDGICVVIVFILSLLALSELVDNQYFNDAIIGSATIYLFIIFLIFSLLKYKVIFEKILVFLPENISLRLEEMIKTSISELLNLKNNKILLKTIFMTICYWSINTLGIYFLLTSYPIPEVFQSFSTAILITGALGVSLTLPSAPANLGIYSYSIILVFKLLGDLYGININDDLLNTITVLSIIMHLATIIPDIVLGGLVFSILPNSLLKKPSHLD